MPSVTPAPLPAATPANDHALLLVRAMIAAALADGTLDATERQTIIGRLEAAGINAEELHFLDAEIARPWSPGQFAAAAPNPEQRAEIYLASALAIDADTDAERTYLRYLAATLSLDDKLIAHLEDAVRGARRVECGVRTGTESARLRLSIAARGGGTAATASRCPTGRKTDQGVRKNEDDPSSPPRLPSPSASPLPSPSRRKPVSATIPTPRRTRFRPRA